MGDWIMKARVRGYEGTVRHKGAAINWRRRLRRSLKVVRKECDTPALILRARTPCSELNRKTTPLAWREPDPKDWFAHKNRNDTRVVGRERTSGRGPVYA